MNIKMEQIHNYQQLNLKNKLRKEAKQEQKHSYGEHFDGCCLGELVKRYRD